MNVVKIFEGNSGSKVQLIEEDQKYFVLKTNVKNARKCANIFERLPFPVPNIYHVTDDSIKMEYIPGSSIQQFLETSSYQEVHKLIDFIVEYFDYGLSYTTPKNYSALCVERNLPIIEVLPSKLIHGDFTLENILYFKDKFFLVDAHYTEFDSIYFDANKLRQDLNGLWFVRKLQNTNNYRIICNYIYQVLTKQFTHMFDEDIYKFMLFRVLPYCKTDSDKKIIESEILRICKS